MKLKEIFPGTWLARYRKPHPLVATFMRVQEFWESPLRIRGRCFSLEEFIEAYAKKNGEFTYMTDYAGFNLPGEAIRRFNAAFSGQMTARERELMRALAEQVPQFLGGGRFYLIGIYQDDDLDHELSHALYYHHRRYQREMNRATRNRRDVKKLRGALRAKGYNNYQFWNEAQAYLATSTLEYLRSFGISTDPSPQEHREIFRRWRKELVHGC